MVRIWAKVAKVWPDTSFFFSHFLKFGSLVFLEIAYNNSLQQYLTSNRGKTYAKKIGSPTFGQTAQNRARN